MTADLAKSFGIAETSGALVSSVVEGSPAAKAGVKAGDVITEYNGRKVARSEDLPRAVAETAVGREVPLTVLRDGKPVTLRATIARLDDTDAPRAMGTRGARESKATLGLSLQPLTPAEARESGLGDRGGVLVRGVQEVPRRPTPGCGPATSSPSQPEAGQERGRREAGDGQARRTSRAFLVHRNGATVYIAVSNWRARAPIVIGGGSTASPKPPHGPLRGRSPAGDGHCSWRSR
jgi:serine protease Do